MNNFMFYSPTHFEFGRGAEAGTGKLVSEFGGHKVMFVYGGGSVVRSGLLDRVKASLDAEGIDYIELAGIQPNPTDVKVYEGIELGRREQIDFLLPVGGGSVIDTAKAIAGGILYDGDFWDFYEGTSIVEKALPLGVVLTIPAAGSEASGNSVITRTEGMKKISLRTPKAFRPKFAVMNPELTFTLPAWQTFAGVSDMMAHIMERYFNNTPGTQVTDALSEALLRTIMQEALKIKADPDSYEARANIMWAGTLAHNGLCGVGCEEDWVSHFMEHELSALYGVTHGAGLAVVFPAWLTFAAEVNPHKVEQFAAEVMHAPSALEGIARLKDFFRSIGMPTTLAELGIENPDIPQLVARLHANKGTIIGGYMKLDAAATRRIYELML